MHNDTNKSKPVTTSDRAKFKVACTLLDTVQEHRCIPFNGGATDTRNEVVRYYSALDAVVATPNLYERFGRHAVALCERHGALTEAQAKEVLRTREGRRQAASGAMRVLFDYLDRLELAGYDAMDAVADAGRTLN
jgi:hypothetical protein